MTTRSWGRMRTVLTFTIALLIGTVGSVLVQKLFAQAPPDHARADDRCTDVRHKDDRRGHGKGHHEHQLECRAAGGSGVARGDFNNDGFGDLAIGVPGEDLLVQRRDFVLQNILNVGQVTVIYGTRVGLLASSDEGVPEARSAEIWHQNVTGVVDSVETNDGFGSAVASGLFNDDDFSDLAVLVPGERDASGAKRGAIHLFFGSAAGLTANGNRLISGSSFSLGGQPLFLLDTVGWGDFNSDGFGDLVVEAATVEGGFGQSPPTAAIVLLPGSATGFSPSTAVVFEIADGSVFVPGDLSLFIVELNFSAGDVDGNTFDDLVIGKPGAPIGGAIELLRFSPAGLTAPDRQVIDQGFTGLSDRSGDEFGAAVAVGRFNDDAFADIAIGVPKESFGTTTGAGEVEVIMGSAIGPNPSDAVRLRQGVGGMLDTAETNDEFGSALAAGDFNGDGIKDLAIGTPEEDVGTTGAAGGVNVIHGSPTGLSSTAGPGAQFFTQTASSGVIEPGDRFGRALTAWDFGGSGPAADLAIGVPDEGVGTVAAAGAVNVIYGSTTSGLSTRQFWTAQSPGVPDSSEASDHFGAAVY